MVGEAVDDPPFYGAADTGKDDGYGLGRPHGRNRWRSSGRHNQIGLSGDKSLSQSGKSGNIALGVAHVDDEVLAYDVASVT